MPNVYVARYEHKFGEDVRVFTTSASAWAWREEIADEWWESEFPASEKPADPKATAEEYFDHMESHGEFFNVDQCELEGPVLWRDTGEAKTQAI